MSLIPIKKEKNTILIVEDNIEENDYITEFLQKKEYKVHQAFDSNEAKKKISETTVSVILLDLTLPPSKNISEGLNLFKYILEVSPDSKVIVLSATGEKKHVVECIRNGAYDYIEKSEMDFNKIEFSIERALQLMEYEKVVKLHLQETKKLSKLGDLVGHSDKMQKIYKLIKQYAETNENIMLLGETGTGKNVTARTIHDFSDRSNQQFLYLNCSTLTPDLLESELFGYEKGAFSGAEKRKIGLFEAANKGTLFLDEIGEISAEMQAKILDTIETKSFRRIGGISNIKVDVRIISATNQDIEKLVDEKKFRLDLHQRMNILSITLPTLRERKDDIKMLGEHLFNLRNNGKCKWISEKCFSLFEKYTFPGNVREYDSIIKEIIIKSPKNHIIKHRILKTILKQRNKNFVVPDFEPLKEVVSKYEMNYINKVIDSCGGSKSKAAKILSITHQGLNKKLKK